jgi:hypothetical protein
MTANQAKPPSNTKGVKTEREKRLSVALRENLRKRKSQSQEREKSKKLPERDGED